MELCSFIYCVVEPQPLFGSVAGPLLAIMLLASAVGPKPPRLYEKLLPICGLSAFTAVAACIWLLIKGPNEALALASCLGCLLMSLTVWLSRGEPDEGGGEWDPYGIDPDAPPPGDQVNWDEAKRKMMREEASRRNRRAVSR